jgi:hypothetical protein
LTREGCREREDVAAETDESSWALHCGTFAALAWKRFTRNGSGWRPPLPPPQRLRLRPIVWPLCALNRCVHIFACSSGRHGRSQCTRVPLAWVSLQLPQFLTSWEVDLPPHVIHTSSTAPGNSARRQAFLARWSPRAVSATAPRLSRHFPRPPQPHAVAPLSLALT